MRSIREQLARLKPAILDGRGADSLDRLPEVEEVVSWEVVAKALGRVGKQQLRANQETGLLAADLRTALEQLKTSNDALREQADEYRRQLQRYELDAKNTRQTALAIIDALDDLSAIARQRNDEKWVSRVNRLTVRTLDTLAEIGLSEIPATDHPFDEQIHEIIDTVDRGAREPYEVVEVLRRGFRFQGLVLRRAQVVTTK